MDPYLHRVVGVYPTRALAQQARDLIAENGMPPTQIRVLTTGSSNALRVAGADAKSDSDDVLKDISRHGAIGTAVGTAAGAGVTIALPAAHTT